MRTYLIPIGLLFALVAKGSETAPTPVDEFKTGIQLIQKAQGESSGLRGDDQRRGAAHISNAAVAGMPEAAEALSSLYEVGIGLPIDSVLSTTWAYVAKLEGKPARAEHLEGIYNPDILSVGLSAAQDFKPNTWAPIKVQEEPKPTPVPEKKPELQLTPDQAIEMFNKLKVTGISSNEKGALCVTIENTILTQGQSMSIEVGAKTYVFECQSLQKDRVVLKIRDTPYTHIYEL